MVIAASLAFAFFILCPRMVGMAAVLSEVRDVNPYAIVTYGTILAIPLMLLMYIVLKNFGATWAIALAVATDVGAAIFMGIHSWKATAQLAIIAIFVWIGILVAKILV